MKEYDIHQYLADKAGITRERAKILNYSLLYRNRILGQTFYTIFEMSILADATVMRCAREKQLYPEQIQPV